MELHTSATIAQKAGVAKHRIDWAIARAGVRPAGRAGMVRLYNREQVKVILAALASTRPHNKVETLTA